MKAMVLESLADLGTRQSPLRLTTLPEPDLNEGDVLLRVTRCGVCHTELDEIEGRTPPLHLPVVLGHQVVGVIEDGEKKGQRVGVAWIASACGTCPHCLAGNENLCAEFKATGRDVNFGRGDVRHVWCDRSPVEISIARRRG